MFSELYKINKKWKQMFFNSIFFSTKQAFFSLNTY